MKTSFLVRFARNKITFWYKTGSADYAPILVQDEHDFAMAFIVNQADIVMGEYAKARFSAGDTNAYYNFFELIETSQTFSFMSESFPVVDLLYFGIEFTLKKYVIENPANFKSDFETIRNEGDLRYFFDNDFPVKYSSTIESLLIKIGFNTVKNLTYPLVLVSILNKSTPSNPIKQAIYLNGIEGDLFTTTIDATSNKIISSHVIEDAGNDPRIKIAAELIFEDLESTNPHLFLKRENVMPLLFDEARNVVNSNLPIIMGQVNIGANNLLDYNFNKNLIKKRLQYFRGDQLMLSELESQIHECGFDSSTVTLILDGKDVNNEYFYEKFSASYKRILRIDDKINKDALSALFLIDINDIGHSTQGDSSDQTQNSKQIDTKERTSTIIGSGPKPPPPPSGISSPTSGQPKAPPPRPKAPAAPPKVPSAPQMSGQPKVPPAPPKAPPLPPAPPKAPPAPSKAPPAPPKAPPSPPKVNK
jgi:hypothetical protein